MEIKISDFFFNFVLPNSCVILLTILKLDVHIYALLNILIYFFVILFAHSSWCNFFPFFILLSWVQCRILNNDNNNNNNNNNDNIIIIIIKKIRTIQFCWYLRKAAREQTYFLKKTRIFPSKNWGKRYKWAVFSK